MGRLVLKNPYFEEEITVKEDRVYFENSLEILNCAWKGTNNAI